MQLAAAYFKKMRAAIDTYAGQRVPFSCNNSSNQRWDAPHLIFDWAMSEMTYKSAHPDHIWQRARAAEANGKLQVFSMPKHRASTLDEIPNEADVEWIARRVVAIAYSAGHLCRVPWDIFMQCDISGYGRYFGKPEQYADLYGFVRAMKPYFEEYTEVAAFGEGIADNRWPVASPVTVEGNPQCYALTRAKPGDWDAPVVIHLVDWNKEVKSLTVRLRMNIFFGGRTPTVRLLVPAAYDGAAHDKAEAAGDYTALVKELDVEVSQEGEILTISVPALNPWGVLIVE